MTVSELGVTHKVRRSPRLLDLVLTMFGQSAEAYYSHWDRVPGCYAKGELWREPTISSKSFGINEGESQREHNNSANLY